VLEDNLYFNCRPVSGNYFNTFFRDQCMLS